MHLFLKNDAREGENAPPQPMAGRSLKIEYKFVVEAGCPHLTANQLSANNWASLIPAGVLLPLHLCLECTL